MSAPARRYKDAIYDQFARIGKALSSPVRLELLDLLCQGPRTVEALAGEVGQSTANTSHHLQVLHAARLLDSDKDGIYVTYRPASDEVCSLVHTVQRLAESRLVEVAHISRQFLQEREVLEPIGSDDLLQRMRAGTVTLLDVRPRQEYRAGHVPGAISVPLDEIDDRLDELPRDRQVVAYCRGPYCVLAVEAIEILRAHGLEAVRMQDGIPEWRAHGFAVETEEALA